MRFPASTNKAWTSNENDSFTRKNNRKWFNIPEHADKICHLLAHSNSLVLSVYIHIYYYPNEIEIVITDDGSLDRTVDVLRSLNLNNLK
jgi:hypothetical protein